ncbi:PIN domain-containing protein [Desulfonatronum parangueonense]
MYLLDTNVVSELRKTRQGKANPGVIRWAEGVASSDLYLSVISVQELEIGVMLAERRDPEKGKILRLWYEDKVLPVFRHRILPIDTQISRCSAKLHVPNPRPVRDAFIAATAIAYGMTVVTRNVHDFEPMGVAFINPWKN